MATARLIIICAILQQCLAQTVVYLADHFDPNYTDPCLENTGELCQFCCLDASATCSSNILWCDPPGDRDLQTLWSAFYILGGIIFGFPVIVVIIRYMLVCRVGQRCYPEVRGVSLFEFISRGIYFCFFCKRFTATYRVADDNMDEEK
jgi:hypothetical protein